MKVEISPSFVWSRWNFVWLPDTKVHIYIDIYVSLCLPLAEALPQVYVQLYIYVCVRDFVYTVMGW